MIALVLCCHSRVVFNAVLHGRNARPSQLIHGLQCLNYEWVVSRHTEWMRAILHATEVLIAKE
eukprot:608408-Rhodomonas_salina.1